MQISSVPICENLWIQLLVANRLLSTFFFKKNDASKPHRVGTTRHSAITSAVLNVKTPATMMNAKTPAAMMNAKTPTIVCPVGVLVLNSASDAKTLSPLSYRALAFLTRDISYVRRRFWNCNHETEGSIQKTNIKWHSHYRLVLILYSTHYMTCCLFPSTIRIPSERYICCEPHSSQCATS